MKLKNQLLAAPLCLMAMLVLPALALASGADAPHLDGAALGAAWVIPFAGMLLSIAIMPLLAPGFWHRHFGKIAAFWALAFLLPFTAFFGVSLALYETIHTLLGEYIPFIVLLFALFTVAGGVRVKGALSGTPAVNAGILLLGTALASWMGTTGAAMLFIRPLLRAIQHRKYRVHTVVFFIFLVANIGGALTPLGDPPLFLGFLRGVPFFWTAQHIWQETLFASVILLCVYFVVDYILYKKEGSPKGPENAGKEKLALEGSINLLLLAGVVGAVLLSGVWKPAYGSITIYHVTVELQNLVRDLLLLGVAGLSWVLTAQQTRKLNDFSWFPIIEVAKIFFGIFISMIPALAILKAGENGALSSLISLVTNEGQPVNSMFFWLTGALSSFLDNAPTYLVFFNTAGGDVATLTTTLGDTLRAISIGAVFMGANTYIGNAPNFMVRSIAGESGVAMPSFFGYMLWSVGILIPLFVLIDLLFIR